MAKKPRTPDTPQLAMLRQITGELAKDIKTEADLNKILNQFVKMTVEAALDAEMEHHLGYAKVPLKAEEVVRVATASHPKCSLHSTASWPSRRPVIATVNLTPLLFKKGKPD
ncbi:transposase [Yersinia aldovae]|uniref:Transposase n=1 Tax=Yersinia aldovae TaxID=29483 RepID=A0A0T9UGD2_YERAL|nr:transposase [Yersinia aldovae]CNL40070.1 transposase [Yersinia aldovae]